MAPRGRGRKRQVRRESDLEVELPQDMADYLAQIPKITLDPSIPVEISPGASIEIDARCERDPKELFRVIVKWSGINVHRATYELLARHAIILLRLDIGGPPHVNPGGEEIPCPHLHRYRQGYGDRWAEPVGDEFGDTENPLDCLLGFLRYCNVVQVPPIRPVRSLFR